MKKDGQRKVEWKKTPTPNLVRLMPGGRYYVRVRLGGKEAHRESLGTTDYQTARGLIDQKLAELRAGAPVRNGELPLTLWDALKVVRQQIDMDPALKKRSVRAYRDIFAALTPGKPTGIPNLPLLQIKSHDLETWWKATAARYAPATANNHLLFVRRACRVARDRGAIFRDPSSELKRLRVPRTKLKLITREQFAKLLAAMREYDDEEAKDAADWVEFVAYSGVRPEEAKYILWENVGEQFLTVTGGAALTKNWLERRVPITAQLRALIKRLPRRESFMLGRGKRFAKILAKVSEAIGLPRLRRYDLRHLFATRCNEAGVDVPTASKWMGHRDGGALYMRTYVHVHEEHEQRAAAKVKF